MLGRLQKRVWRTYLYLGQCGRKRCCSVAGLEKENDEGKLEGRLALTLSDVLSI